MMHEVDGLVEKIFKVLRAGFALVRKMKKKLKKCFVRVVNRVKVSLMRCTSWRKTKEQAR
jgi:hypothetical protein